MKTIFELFGLIALDRAPAHDRAITRSTPRVRRREGIGEAGDILMIVRRSQPVSTQDARRPAPTRLGLRTGAPWASTARWPPGIAERINLKAKNPPHETVTTSERLSRRFIVHHQYYDV
jgi:hypothetical protein